MLAANTDEVAGRGTTASARELSQSIGCPYPVIGIDQNTVQLLDLFQRSFLDLWLPLPVPSSFLVDRHGRVAVIYKGPVHPEALIHDLELLDADAETLRKAATPLTGRWTGSPPSIGVSDFVRQLLDRNQLSNAEKFVSRYLTSERNAPNATLSSMITALRTSALLVSNRGKYTEAMASLKEALQLTPQNLEIQSLLAEVEAKANIAGQAVTEKAQRELAALQAKVEAAPTSGAAHLALADAYRANGNYSKAIEGYKNTLRNDPKLFVAAGKLAWIFGSHPSPEIREPKAALELTSRLMKLNGGGDPSILDLRGIALAANGDFVAAAENARAALDKIKEETPYKKAIALRLSLYEAGKPYLEGAAK